MPTLLIAAALLSVTPQPSSADLKQARELFEKGRVDYRNGDFRKAIAEFLDADKIKPSPALLYNVAQAYEKLGDQAKAVEYYQMYLQRDPAASDREAVKATILNLQSRIEAEPATAVVVMANAPGTPATVVSVPPAATGLAPVGTATATSTAEDKPRRSHALSITLGSIGVVAGGLAIVGAAEVGGFQSTRNEIQSGKGYTGTFADANNQANQANIWGISAIVLAVVAAAGLTAAVVTW